MTIKGCGLRDWTVDKLLTKHLQMPFIYCCCYSNSSDIMCAYFVGTVRDRYTAKILVLNYYFLISSALFMSNFIYEAV